MARKVGTKYAILPNPFYLKRPILAFYIFNFNYPMKECFYGSIILILLTYIFLSRKKAKKKQRDYPDGDYVLKIIINENKKKDCMNIINCLKEAVFNLTNTLFEDKDLYNKWRSRGEGKIVLIANEEDLKKIKEESQKQKIPCLLCDDTMVLVGPGLKTTINQFTGHLKLF